MQSVNIQSFGFLPQASLKSNTPPYSANPHNVRESTQSASATSSTTRSRSIRETATVTSRESGCWARQSSSFDGCVRRGTDPRVAPNYSVIASCCWPRASRRAARDFTPFTRAMDLYLSVYHKSRVPSERLDESSSFMAQGLPSTDPTICSKIRVLSSGTLFQTLDIIENFRNCTSTVMCCKRRWTVSITNRWRSSVASLWRWASTFVYNTMDVTQRVALVCLWQLRPVKREGRIQSSNSGTLIKSESLE